MFVVENMMESVVKSMLEEVMEKEGCCMCERCKLDVYAITLNKLPAKYTVSVAGRVFEGWQQNKAQGRMQVYQQMLQAIDIVKQFPRHADK